MHFQQAATVTSLSFFSNLTKAPLLLSAGSNGHVCLWDIKERRAGGRARGQRAHGAVSPRQHAVRDGGRRPRNEDVAGGRGGPLSASSDRAPGPHRQLCTHPLLRQASEEEMTRRLQLGGGARGWRRRSGDEPSLRGPRRGLPRLPRDAREHQPGAVAGQRREATQVLAPGARLPAPAGDRR